MLIALLCNAINLYATTVWNGKLPFVFRRRETVKYLFFFQKIPKNYLQQPIPLFPELHGFRPCPDFLIRKKGKPNFRVSLTES